MNSMNSIRLISVAMLALGLAACASMPSAQYQTSIRVGTSLESGAPASVGKATAAADVRNDKLTLRGATMTSSATDGTFSGYVREALITELKSANRYSETSTRRIDLQLTKHSVNINGFKEGFADLGARIVVSEGTEVRLEKTFEIKHTWPSAFIGAVAIQAGYDNYPAAVQKLIEQIVADPEFVNAIK